MCQPFHILINLIIQTSPTEKWAQDKILKLNQNFILRMMHTANT